jgi:putative phage-type endonuclease
MKTVSEEVPINRAEWLKARVEGIGGSDAAAVMGLSPYMTNVELWKIKTGRTVPEDISEKPYVKFGTEAEKHIRALFELEHPEYQIDYNQYKLHSNPEYPFIFATLDGEIRALNGKRGVLEIKTTEIRHFGQWKEWEHRIPDVYYIQILHQLLATGWDFACVAAYIKYTSRNGDKQCLTKGYIMERREYQEDIDMLLEKEIKFWKYVEDDKEPPLILPRI